MIIKEINTNEKKYLKASFSIEDVNCKSVTIDGVEYFTFKGYASTFGNIDRHDEIMARGCFEESLKNMKPSLLWQHDMREPVGVFDVVKEKGNGLYVEGRLPLTDTLVSGRVVPQIKAGSIRSMSIGFTVKSYLEDRETGIITFTKVNLWEISLVTIPANSQAVITDFKELDKELDEATSLKDIEKYLKSYGVSHKKCGKIISKVKNFIRDGQSLDNNEEELPSDLEAELKTIFEKIEKLKMEV